MSRKPAVVMNAVAAVCPSMIAFVATVVAWTTYRIDPGRTSDSTSRRSSAVMKPTDGSRGVVRPFAIRYEPVRSSTRIPSVNVPPMSIPTRNGVASRPAPSSSRTLRRSEARPRGNRRLLVHRPRLRVDDDAVDLTRPLERHHPVAYVVQDALRRTPQRLAVAPAAAGAIADDVAAPDVDGRLRVQAGGLA